MYMRTITALFDTVAAANHAMQALATEVGGVRGAIYSTASSLDTGIRIPAEDRAVLEEHIRRRGAVFYGQVPDDRFDTAATLLENAGAADIDEREAQWRREGWTGGTSTTSSTTAIAGTTETRGVSGAGLGAGAAGTTRTQDFGTEAGRDSIPIIEERLIIGKRETTHGRVRVRSYVVETPVEEQVTLHTERVDVQRRPVDRPLAADDDAFRERTIEATETSEEAVVSKEARVKEEVVVRKDAEERTQTVSDTVRRTEVEVDDQRGAAGTTGTTTGVTGTTTGTTGTTGPASTRTETTRTTTTGAGSTKTKVNEGH
jgi:uncharacterized protein (TIGR02271 family)